MSDKIYCTYCGALNEANAKFCERCGHELEPIMMPAAAAAESGAASSGEDLLSELMEEPVTAIPEEETETAAKGVLPKGLAAEIAAAEEHAAGDPAFESSGMPHKEQTQVFTRADLEAAIAADNNREREERARALQKQKEAERAKQRERMLEESRRHQEYERMRQEEQRAEKLRRQQEEALYADFEQPADQRAQYAGDGRGRYAQDSRSRYDGSDRSPYAAGYGAGAYADDPYDDDRRGGGSKRWIIIALVVLLLAGGGFAGWKLFFNKTTVNLTRNISMQDFYLEGSSGDAIVIYDEETFRARADYPRGNENAEKFMESVTYTVEPSTGLSNGDTVTVRAVVSEETAKALHINVTGEEKEFKVEGLAGGSTAAGENPLDILNNKDTDKKDDTDTKKEEADAADTLIPGIDTRYYTDADVYGKSKEDVQAMINELYARHGYIFKDETLKAQYEKQSWYKGTESDMNKVEQSFNDYEMKNKDFLSTYR